MFVIVFQVIQVSPEFLVYHTNLVYTHNLNATHIVFHLFKAQLTIFINRKEAVYGVPINIITRLIRKGNPRNGTFPEVVYHLFHNIGFSRPCSAVYHQSLTAFQ